MFSSFEPMRRRQLALGDAVSEMLHATVRTELDSSFTRSAAKEEMESMLQGHWKQVLPDAPITMGRFRAAWACTLAGLQLAGRVAKACDAGRAPLLLSDGRLFGLADDAGKDDADSPFVSVISEGIALPYDSSHAVWRSLCAAITGRKTTVPGIEIFSAHFYGCVRLLPAPASW